MSDDNKQQSIAEKELGNQAYKKRQFEEALVHYDKAWDLDNTNIPVLTNKAGKSHSLLPRQCTHPTVCSCSFRAGEVPRVYRDVREGR